LGEEAQGGSIDSPRVMTPDSAIWSA